MTIRRVLLGTVVLALLAACGLPASSEPQLIEEAELPSELLTVSPSSSTTLAPTPTSTSATVYFLQVVDGITHLVPVQREVANGTRPGDRIIALLGAPSADEAAFGIISSIPADTVLLDTEIDETTQEVTIELSRALFDVQGAELRNAFAQLVWTATELNGIRRVSFVVDGQEYRAPDEAGIEQPGAVTRSDYRTLAPLGS